MNLTAADIAYVRAGFDSLDERFADVWATAPL